MTGVGCGGGDGAGIGADAGGACAVRRDRVVHVDIREVVGGLVEHVLVPRVDILCFGSLGSSHDVGEVIVVVMIETIETLKTPLMK